MSSSGTYQCRIPPLRVVSDILVSLGYPFHSDHISVVSRDEFVQYARERYNEIPPEDIPELFEEWQCEILANEAHREEEEYVNDGDEVRTMTQVSRQLEELVGHPYYLYLPSANPNPYLVSTPSQVYKPSPCQCSCIAESCRTSTLIGFLNFRCHSHRR